MKNHLNPHGASPVLIKEQELENNLIEAEFAWNDAKTLDEKKKALELVNSALGEIEKFHKEKGSKKPNLYFDVDPSLIPTMMQEMEARIIKHERLQNWQNPEWMDKQLDELSNLKEMGYSESEAEKYVGILGNSVEEVKEILDLESKDYSKLNCIYPIDEVKWDNQSWAEQRG
jgi:hypothetical protein